MPKFRITNKATNHRRKEGKSWKSYRYGDEIDLTAKQFESGKFDHLRLVPLYGTETVSDEDAAAIAASADAGKTNEDPPEDPVDGDEITKEEVQELIKRVKDSKVDDGTFETVRKDIIELDLFENLPETKTGVLEALESLIEG